VNDDSCSGADELPGVAEVGLEFDELLDELPQALVARTTPTETAQSAAHFETRMRNPFSVRVALALIPI
jgi:hypothetical protein